MSVPMVLDDAERRDARTTAAGWYIVSKVNDRGRDRVAVAHQHKIGHLAQ